MKIVTAPTGAYLIGRTKVARIPSTLYSNQEELLSLAESYRDSVDTAAHGIQPYHVTVLTSTSCNLACPYCFQNTDSLDPGRPPARIPALQLTTGRVEMIAAFIRSQIERLERDGATVLLFGGEPLLRYRECVDLLTAFAKLPLKHAGLQTNATLLTSERLEELHDLGVIRVHVTFDGDRATHDQSRKYRDGRGSFDRIMTNLEQCSSEPDIRWHIRFNVTRDSIDDIVPVFESLAEVLPTERSTISLAPILDYGQGAEGLIQRSDRVATMLKRCYEHILELGFQPLPILESSCAYCSIEGGDGGAVVTPDGTLYSCWDIAGRREFAVGDVETGYDKGLVSANWHHCLEGVEVDQGFGNGLYADIESELLLFWLDVWEARHRTIANQSQKGGGTQ